MSALGVAILDAVREMTADERAELARLLGPGEPPAVEDASVPALMTVEEAATRARCHPETLRRASRTDALRASRVGSTWRISPEALTAWLNRPRVHAPEPQARSARARRRQPEHGGAVAQAFAALDKRG